MAHRKRRGARSSPFRLFGMESFSLSHGMVMMAIVAGAGLWGYALFNIATRPL